MFSVTFISNFKGIYGKHLFSLFIILSFSGRTFNAPLPDEDLVDLSHKNFSPETLKKVRWVTKMYREWRNYRHASGFQYISCDLDQVSSITQESLVFALCRFLTEIKKVDGSNFPGKTLYDIVVYVQFQLECLGLNWKILNQQLFGDVRFTLDNLMKQRTAQGIGVSVKKAQILSHTDEDYLWSAGLLGCHTPDILLNTVVFMIGKGFALRAGKEHHCLRSPPNGSQFEFLHDSDGSTFIRYREEIGLKTNKGGLKHRKVDPKIVDMYPIQNSDRCPVRLIINYLCKLPKQRKCQSFYLQPIKKFGPDRWFRDQPAGVNRLRDTIKDMCKKAGLPGFYSNHSLRSTSATNLYRCNIDEQLIQEITGHRSLAVRSYKRTCDAQRKFASNCIFSGPK